MPSVLVRGLVNEVSTLDYYLYWYRFVEPLVSVCGYFTYFPNRDNWGAAELEKMLAFLRDNLEAIEDTELREKAIALIEFIEPLPQAHQEMLHEITAQMGIENPLSSQGKRRFTLQWKKLLARQTPTEEMKHALTILQAYITWLNPQIQEITRNKEQFQQRIVKIFPEVLEGLRNP